MRDAMRISYCVQEEWSLMRLSFCWKFVGKFFGLSQRASGQSFKAQEGISVRFAASGNKMDKKEI